MTGLMVARALQPHAEAIVVVDHDELPEGSACRGGASQMYHSHALLDRGRELLEDLFPGLVDSTAQPFSRPRDHGLHLRWHQYGTWKPRVRSGVDVWQFDRARVEGAMRACVRKLPNVELCGGERVVGYLRGEGGAVRGVEVERDGETLERSAETVVDAMGRGTRTPGLLERDGSNVPVRSYSPRVTYTTGDFGWPDGYDGDWSGMFVLPESRDEPRAGIMYPVDDERFRLTLAGWVGQRAPVDEQGFRRFAASLPTSAVAESLDAMDSAGPLRRYRIPEAMFRRYDEMGDRPTGLVAVGDSLCSFNPIFGQGITMAARQVSTLRDLVARRNGPGILSRADVDAYYRRSAAMLRVPWLLTAAYDHQFPGVDGDERLARRLSPLVQFIHRESGRDPEVYRALLKVMHMQASPIHLLRPASLSSLARSGISRLFGRFRGTASN